MARPERCVFAGSLRYFNDFLLPIHLYLNSGSRARLLRLFQFGWVRADGNDGSLRRTRFAPEDGFQGGTRLSVRKYLS